jgi:hypothetical protein
MISELEWREPGSEVVPVPPPAAGAGFTYDVPGTLEAEIVSVQFTLTTSATVASRIPVLSFVGPGGVTFASIAAAFHTAASLTSTYLFAYGIQQFGADDAANIGAPIPCYKLRVGQGISVAVTAIDATDAISNVVVAAREWPVRAPLGN